MKLISCYVRAFGTLKDIQIEFGDGLNIFLCDNGNGKTTLISFIKAMLYGLDYRQGSSKFYERTHFMPWDGSECGGSLVIEEGGAKLRIERTFGKKQTDDTFKLYDEDALRETNVYGQDIGEKILGVDKLSFERSLFFGQGSLETAITPSLNAKMGNLSDVHDDMNRFDEAIKSIEKARAEYEKKSAKNPGKINVIDAKIKECEAAAEQIPIMENGVAERKRSIEEKKSRIEELLKIKEELSDKIKAAGEKKERAGAINAKREQLKKLREDIAGQEDFFAGKIPEHEEIESMQGKQRELVERMSRQAEIRERIPDDERVSFMLSVFGGENAVSEEMIETSLSEAEEIAKLRLSGEKTALLEENEKALEEAREFFKDKLPTTEEIALYRQHSEKITESEAGIKTLRERQKLESDALAEAEEQTGGKPLLIMILVGALFMIAGMFCGMSIGNPNLAMVGLVSGLVIGVILIMTGLVFLYHEKSTRQREIKRASQRFEDLSGQIQTALSESEELKKECLDFIREFMEVEDDCNILATLIEIQRKLDEYERLLALNDVTKKDTAQNTDALAELQLNLYTRLASSAEKYGYDLFNDHKEKELLSILSDDIKEYDSYLANTESVLKLKNEMDAIEDELNTFMDRYKWDETKNTEQRLLVLRGHLDSYNSGRNRIVELEKELEDIGEIPGEKDEESLEELQEKSLEIDEQYEPLVSDRAKEEEELSRAINDIEDMEEKVRGLSALKERRAELAERTAVLSDTKKYLEQARDDFLSVYMKPLRESMNKYINLFIPEGVVNDIEITMDMDLSLSLLHRGSQYSGEYLSEGYKDLAALCARLALIDVLYKGKRPTLMMDDPFTNLDEKKIQRALRILEDISKGTQVIYFTCHESRSAGETRTII